jgi:transcriptional regulator with AAA-type ATPase domain
VRDELLASLITRLIAAASFEDAATAVLQAMLGCAGAALTQSPYAARGRLLRGVVHLRPADSYQRLFGIEHRGGARIEEVGYLTSANVWRWLVEHGCSVSIDLQLGLLRAWTLDGPIQTSDAFDTTGLPGQVSREHMLGRNTTHVHVIPLRAPGGAVDGMITLEARCQAAIGREFVWKECHEDLAAMASVSAPYLGGLRPRLPEGARTDELLPVVGASTASLVDMLRVFAGQEETILIGGPTGSGKSRLARWCHEHSRRKAHGFETLDLLSVPEDLQMAELFGWKRGAFTGAVKDKPGAIARAAQGTLFIDEIDKLSLKAQAGLLHVLEERRYRPLGDEAGERHADVRFIVGTNADLHAAVRAGRFREDLFFRINILPVRLPPLSERLDELPRWAEYMLSRRHRESGGEGAARLAPDAVERLLDAAWPGNLRQLDNILRRAYALALAERGGAGGSLVLERRHAERALAHEAAPSGSGSTLVQLWRAAHAFVQEAERRERGGVALPLDLTDAFRGLVLAAAIGRLGSREEAFAMFGLEQLLKNRNHQRALRRELARVRRLASLLGESPDPDLAALLKETDEPGEPRGG